MVAVMVERRDVGDWWRSMETAWTHRQEFDEECLV
jgi:hypothetical protein